jgi:hypothetical protein
MWTFVVGIFTVQSLEKKLGRNTGAYIDKFNSICLAIAFYFYAKGLYAR